MNKEECFFHDWRGDGPGLKGLCEELGFVSFKTVMALKGKRRTVTSSD